MPNPVGVYNFIEVYLRQKGVMACAITRCPSGLPDAAQVLHFVIAVKQSACCTNAEGSCVLVSIHILLEHMSRVDGWNTTHHRSALVAGDYAPDFIPWSKKPAGP